MAETLSAVVLLSPFGEKTKMFKASDTFEHSSEQWTLNCRNLTVNLKLLKVSVRSILLTLMSTLQKDLICPCEILHLKHLMQRDTQMLHSAYMTLYESLYMYHSACVTLYVSFYMHHSVLISLCGSLYMYHCIDHCVGITRYGSLFGSSCESSDAVALITVFYCSLLTITARHTYSLWYTIFLP